MAKVTTAMYLHCAPYWTRNRPMDFEVPPEILPETVKYTLRALVLQGSDIPVFKFPNTQVRGISSSTV